MKGEKNQDLTPNELKKKGGGVGKLLFNIPLI